MGTGSTEDNEDVAEDKDENKDNTDNTCDKDNMDSRTRSAHSIVGLRSPVSSRYCTAPQAGSRQLPAAASSSSTLDGSAAGA